MEDVLVLGYCGSTNSLNRIQYRVRAETTLTDPLTGKELVEKSYEYILKLSKECAKSLLDDFNASHAKFKTENLSSEVSSHVLKWFERRDKGIRLISEPASKGQANVTYLKFKGSTKDADFTFTGVLGSFSSFGPDGEAMSFAKTLTFSVDKANFSRRK
jgi:hypothetical protein